MRSMAPPRQQADRHRLDEAPEVVDNSRIADRQRLATAALAAHTPLGERPFVEIVLAAIDGRARDPGDPLNDGEAAITGGLHLVCGKQPTATLVELGAHRLPPSSDAILVDHGKRDTSVRAAPESPRVNPPQPTDHDSLISAGVLIPSGSWLRARPCPSAPPRPPDASRARPGWTRSARRQARSGGLCLPDPRWRL